MLVIGIDPGTARTGYGIVSEDVHGIINTLDFGVIFTDANLPFAERLLHIYRSLNQIIQTHHPLSAAVEKIFFQKNVRTAFSVGQARGVVLLSLAQAGIPITEYTPLEIKQAITGYGKADKKQVQFMVRSLLNLDSIPKPDDAADALAIAICHLQTQKYYTLIQGE